MIFSSDTNIWIDLDTLEIIEIPFLSAHEFYMSQDAITDELLSPPDLTDRLVTLGIKPVIFDLEEFYLAEQYQHRYPKLSKYDALALDRKSVV